MVYLNLLPKDDITLSVYIGRFASINVYYLSIE